MYGCFWICWSLLAEYIKKERHPFVNALVLQQKYKLFWNFQKLFYDGRPYHIETSYMDLRHEIVKGVTEKFDQESITRKLRKIFAFYRRSSTKTQF